jgi:hypothetical protein
MVIDESPQHRKSPQGQPREELIGTLLAMALYGMSASSEESTNNCSTYIYRRLRPSGVCLRPDNLAEI